MTRKRLAGLRYSHDDIEAITELVALHLRFTPIRWAGRTPLCAVTCATPTVARRAERADALRLHDSQRAQGGRAGKAEDELEDGSWSSPSAEDRLDSTELDGKQVMDQLGIVRARLSARLVVPAGDPPGGGHCSVTPRFAADSISGELTARGADTIHGGSAQHATIVVGTHGRTERAA